MVKRSERLAEIVEIVRDGRLHTACSLSGALKVSERTIYRDIDTLVASGVPIEGERGVGYLLREPVFLPPVALSMIELEALSLGMAIVEQAADEELKAGASSLLDKLEHHASVRRRAPSNWGFGVYALKMERSGFRHLPIIRRAIRETQKLALSYTSIDGVASERVVRPLQTEYWGQVWTLSTWCELRNDFRVFRIDQLERCETNGEPFVPEPGKMLADDLLQVSDNLRKQSRQE